MSVLDSAMEAAKKAAAAAQVAAGAAAEKSKVFAADHKEQVGRAVTKGGSIADKQTKGRFAGQIGKVTGAASSLVDKLPDKQ